MAVVTLAAEVNHNGVTMTQNSWVDLVNAATVTGTGNVALITANVAGLNPAQVQTRIVIDGTEITEADSTAGVLTCVAETLSIGTHTIKFQGYAFDSGETSSYSFMTIANMA